MNIEQTLFLGLSAYRLRCDTYEAVILPQFGANCVSLIHRPTGTECLRVPPTAEEMADHVNVYGLPIQFPPNRILRGRFTFRGREYTFPINEPARSCFIHGVLSAAPFEMEREGVFVYHATAEKPYLAFPHAFTLEREYRLTDEGLFHTVRVRNDSDREMPVAVGIHAAWNVFSPEAALRIPAEYQNDIDREFIMPTGKEITESPQLDALRKGTLQPEKEALSTLLTTRGQKVSLADESRAFCYDSDPSMPFVMLWNGGGGTGFVCPEPQSWVPHAPLLDWPWEKSGMDSLMPGKEKTYSLRFWMETK